MRQFTPNTEVDFVVIGSGAAGGIMAKQLSTAGFTVVVLEQGGWGKYGRDKEYTKDEWINRNLPPEDRLMSNPTLQRNTFRRSEKDKTVPGTHSYGCVVGGGTVTYVSPDHHLYITEPEHREEGGTPAIIESIRAGLAFRLKETVGDLTRATAELLTAIIGLCPIPRRDVSAADRIERLETARPVASRRPRPTPRGRPRGDPGGGEPSGLARYRPGPGPAAGHLGLGCGAGGHRADRFQALPPRRQARQARALLWWLRQGRRCRSPAPPRSRQPGCRP